MSFPIIAPSLLAADFSDFGAALAMIAAAKAPWVHLDIMDGRFVPNISFGPKLLSDLRHGTTLFFDVHLMTLEPEKLAPVFISAGADAITFHLEACVHAQRLIQEIKASGKKAGVSIVPSSPVHLLDSLLVFLDMVLIMTVNPGFSGQMMILECLEKVRLLAAMRKERDLSFLIAVDGGINRDNAQLLVQSGADILVMGNAFFEADDKASLVRDCTRGL